MQKIVQTLNQFRDVIQFGALFIVGFIWMESQYVDASELKAYIDRDIENQIYFLVQKRERLRDEGKQLPQEERALLEKLRQDLAKEK